MNSLHQIQKVPARSPSSNRWSFRVYIWQRTTWDMPEERFSRFLRIFVGGENFHPSPWSRLMANLMANWLQFLHAFVNSGGVMNRPSRCKTAGDGAMPTAVRHLRQCPRCPKISVASPGLTKIERRAFGGVHNDLKNHDRPNWSEKKESQVMWLLPAGPNFGAVGSCFCFKV